MMPEVMWKAIKLSSIFLLYPSISLFLSVSWFLCLPPPPSKKILHWISHLSSPCTQHAHTTRWNRWFMQDLFSVHKTNTPCALLLSLSTSFSLVLFPSVFIPSTHTHTHTYALSLFLARKGRCQVEEIHHGDRGGVRQPEERLTCSSVSVFVDDLVSQPFVPALLTEFDHAEQIDNILPHRDDQGEKSCHPGSHVVRKFFWRSEKRLLECLCRTNQRTFRYKSYFFKMSKKRNECLLCRMASSHISPFHQCGVTDYL